MTRAPRFLAAAFLLFTTTAGGTELRGHGGPVRAIAVAPEGTAITGSFDTRAIVWSLETGEAREVLLFHGDEVNAVAVLPDGRFVTAGADSRIAIWESGRQAPVRVLEGHSGPVTALAVSPDGATLASASWDTTVRLWPVAGGDARVLEGHDGNVNAVTFLADGTPASAGYDANLIFWPRDMGAAAVRVVLPTPLNTLVALRGNRLAVGGADGMVRVLDRDGTTGSEVQATQSPVVTLAASPDGRYLAAAGIRGAIILLDATDLAPVRDLRGPGMPVWSLAFTPDGKTLLTGGSDRVVREWDVETGEHLGATMTDETDPLAEFAGDRGAEAFRACIACHTLDPEDDNRAGPTLHGIFGRKIASVPGYRYSPALRDMDIVWTPQTVSKLFEVGPNTYTPGTKMPEQTISDDETRAALIRFLQRETRTE
ncbi:c-type cytochrome [Chelativorans salis]|uniref:C-type cytochrome n=1 Tax=Chelativorans salis TaxID=2978478 RepID=A0ABT2LRJ5_9HYPH|nr:c-type cytochrome [Chelativorans sp. EGI FJ00035]MCT7377175.1 c-type cytochrome [Chelativorans sp. EGI FJ00035]